MSIAAKLSVLMSTVLGMSTVGASDALPSIIATYVVERPQSGKAAPSSFQWVLHRSESCVTASDSNSRVTEQWSRDEQGRIWYKRIFHNEKKVIEYQPVDLRIGGVEGKWSRIASVIDPAELQSMSLQSEAGAFDGRPASIYRGLRQGLQWEVWWLAGELLPARIVIDGEGAGYTLRLRKLDTGGAAGPVRCNGGDLQAYETIDFADIGDRQGDPFIQGLMNYEGFSHGHGH